MGPLVQFEYGSLRSLFSSCAHHTILARSYRVRDLLDAW